MQWNILWQWGSWNWGWNDPVVDDDNGVVVGDVGAAVVVVVVAVAAVAAAVAAVAAAAVCVGRLQSWLVLVVTFLVQWWG